MTPMTPVETLATSPADFPVLALLQLLPLSAAILMLALRREGPAIAIGVAMATIELVLEASARWGFGDTAVDYEWTVGD